MTDSADVKQSVIQERILRGGFRDHTMNELAEANEFDLEKVVQRASELCQTNEPATIDFGIVQSDAQRAGLLLLHIQSHWPNKLLV